MIEMAFFGRAIADAEVRQGKGKAYVSFLASAETTDEEGAETSLIIKVLAFGDLIEEASAIRKDDRVYIEGQCSISIWHSKGVARPSVAVKAHHLRRPRVGERREVTAEAKSIAAALSRPIEALTDLPAFILNKPRVATEGNACQPAE